jgi:uncharacterized protein (TIGR02421 family)
VPETIAPDLIDTICSRLRDGLRVRRFLPRRGRLHIDRPLPFLVVYRRPVDRDDAGTDRLVIGEGSYLVAPGEESLQPEVGQLVQAVVKTLAERFGAFVLLELWSGSGDGETFRIGMPTEEYDRGTVAALARGVRRMAVRGWKPRFKLVRGGGHSPPGLPSLMTTAEARRLSCMMLGLEVPPAYQDPVTGQVYPKMLRHLHRGTSRALQQAFFAFAHVQTRATIEHYHALGRRAMVQAVWRADQQLGEIADSFDFLLSVTPVNTSRAYAEFEAGGFRKPPVLHYRLIPVDPDLLKRRLYEVPIEKMEDLAVAELFVEKRRELDRQITMLDDRDAPEFFHGSMQLYGGVSDELLALAEAMLSHSAGTPSPGTPGTRALSPGTAGEGKQVDATTFARRASAEIDHYRQHDDRMAATVEIREDVPGLMVSGNRLLIGQRLEIPANRVEPLIAHEVGTHLLTWANGRAQPLQLLHNGVAGYEELQEGIAVLSEWLVGGLTRSRLRLLAARVVAVHRLTRESTFTDVFAELHEQYGFTAASAFSITTRVYRGGGLTKDAIYLRGLVRLLHHLAGGNDLEELLIGKISLAALEVVRELQWRQVLLPPAIKPLYLQGPAAEAKLHQLRRGLSVLDLFEEETS